MAIQILMVPGYQGSGAGHWQSWMEQHITGARRLGGVCWEQPVFDLWRTALEEQIAQTDDSVCLVAHSFGCLVALSAAYQHSERMAGVLLVAPADPLHFSANGWRNPASPDTDLSHVLPVESLPFPALLVASENDPWMHPARIRDWTNIWQCPVVNIGAAGHINEASGFGPWPQGMNFLRVLLTGCHAPNLRCA